MDHDLARRASAEAVGTALLVAVIVGSGIAAQRLAPGDAGLELLANSLATGAGLVALIVAFAPVSGAHLNPAVTLTQRLRGEVGTRTALVYVAAQCVGACAGAIVANLMFDLPAVTISTHHRGGANLWLAEFVATFGLVLVVVGAARAGRAAVTAVAVGGYITAAYWFTSSTSFANPAVTIARTLTDTFTGIAPSNVPGFITFQIIGALAAVALARLWYQQSSVPALAVLPGAAGEEQQP